MRSTLAKRAASHASFCEVATCEGSGQCRCNRNAGGTGSSRGTAVSRATWRLPKQAAQQGRLASRGKSVASGGAGGSSACARACSSRKTQERLDRSAVFMLSSQAAPQALASYQCVPHARCVACVLFELCSRAHCACGSGICSRPTFGRSILAGCLPNVNTLASCVSLATETVADRLLARGCCCRR